MRKILLLLLFVMLLSGVSGAAAYQRNPSVITPENARQLALLQTFDLHDFYPFGMIFDPTSTGSPRLVISGKAGVRVVSVSSDPQMTVFDDKVSLYGRSLIFSPNGRLLAAQVTFGDASTTTTTHTALYIWDTASAQKYLAIPQAGSGLPLGMAFSPDGKRFAYIGTEYNETGGYLEYQLVLVNLASAERLILVRTQDLLYEIAFRPDGKLLYTSTSSTSGGTFIKDRPVMLHSLDVDTGVEDDLVTLPDQVLAINADFSMAAVSDDLFRKVPDADTRTSLVDLTTGKVLHTLQYEGVLNYPTFSRDGRLLAGVTVSKRDGTDMTTSLYVWDTSTGDLLKREDLGAGWLSDVRFSPDGNWIVSSYSDVVANTNSLKFWGIGG